MASSLVVLKVTSLVVMCMVVAAPFAQAAVSCGQVTSALAPCISYVRNGGAVPASCCSGVRTINNSAKTTPDRQAVCKCLKSIAGSISGFKPGLVAGLPAKCGVNVPFKISTSTNCATVK